MAHVLARPVDDLIQAKIDAGSVLWVRTLHMSTVSQLELGVGATNVTAWQIVAPGLYAPMPFPNALRSEYTWLSDAPATWRQGRRGHRAAIRICSGCRRRRDAVRLGAG